MNLRIQKSELSAEALPEDGRWRVRFSGVADTRVVSELDALLKTLHREVVRGGAEEVIVDFRALEFMNSSCFKPFVAWFAELRGLEPSKRYRVCFKSDEDKHWQRRSLHALSSFGLDFVRIET